MKNTSVSLGNYFDEFVIGQVTVGPASSPRKGWDKAFKKMHENGDDKALMADIFEDENLEEWS